MPRRQLEIARTVASSPVIASHSLVASGARFSGNESRLYNDTLRPVQKECYEHYATMGEARFAANLYGNAFGRIRFYVDDGNGKELTSGAAFEVWEAFGNGQQGRQELMNLIGIHMPVAGECYAIGREVGGADSWEILSINEVHGGNGNMPWWIDYGSGMSQIQLTESDVAIRLWKPSPIRRMEADSAFMSLLPVLDQIRMAQNYINTQMRSRLVSAGILALPMGISFPKAPPEANVPETLPEVDQFIAYLGWLMQQTDADPNKIISQVPLMIQVEDTLIEKIQHITFWTPLDEQAGSILERNIFRFADGMDLPKERVLGMSSNPGTGGGRTSGVSHWGAWQVEEDTIKLHFEPMLDPVVNTLTMLYLRPGSEGMNGVTGRERIRYDTTPLHSRPDRSQEAINLQHLLKPEVVAHENGFKPEDLMSDEERKTWILLKLASGSATPELLSWSLRQLGLPDVPEPASIDIRSMPAELPPEPSAPDPQRPRTPAESAAVSPVIAAADSLVYRALERAGNRIRSASGQKPPVESYRTHEIVRGDADAALVDAWSTAPMVLSGVARHEDLVPTLHAYTAYLINSQQPHSRESLIDWLETAQA